MTTERFDGSQWSESTDERFDGSAFQTAAVERFDGSQWSESGGGGSVTVVDDFESGSLDSSYTGDTGAATIVSSPVANGGYALQLDASNNPLIYSASGLPAYPGDGDTYRVEVRTPDATIGDNRVCYAVQDPGNQYQIRLNYANDELVYLKQSNGSGSEASPPATISFPSGIYLTVELQWSGDTHTATVFDSGSELGSTTMTDSTFGPGGIGFRSTNNAGSSNELFDYARLV